MLSRTPAPSRTVHAIFPTHSSRIRPRGLQGFCYFAHPLACFAFVFTYRPIVPKSRVVRASGTPYFSVSFDLYRSNIKEVDGFLAVIGLETPARISVRAKIFPCRKVRPRGFSQSSMVDCAVSICSCTTEILARVELSVLSKTFEAT